MPSPWWQDDDRLFAELREALRSRPAVAADLLRAGKAAYTWRTVDAELAELAYDSLTEEDGLLGVRGSTACHTMVFDGPAVSIEVEVSGARITGQLVPPQSGRVQVLTVDALGPEERVDEIGRFSIDAREANPVRLRFTTEDGTAVVTGWIPLPRA